MNAAVELHDSEVVSVTRAGDTVVVRLAAYVHRSAGRPGYDPGSGWSQAVELTFAGGVVEREPPELPCTLNNGAVSGGVAFDGLVPLPASVPAPVRFEARELSGEQLVVRGSGLAVRPAGEAVFVETFPG